MSKHMVQAAHAWRRDVRPVPTPPRWAVIAGALLVLGLLIGGAVVMAMPVNWFDTLGRCLCGKPAVGTLRGAGNVSYGHWCQRCADKKLREAEKDRAKVVKP